MMISDYIGKEWSETGDGPDAFSCWGLVRHCWGARHGIKLPFIPVGQETPSNVRAIKKAAEVSGLRRVFRAPRDFDIVVLPSVLELHVGLAMTVNGRMGLLDSTRGRGVTWQPWREAVPSGPGKYELWGWP